jgi:hypothetical protein
MLTSAMQERGSEIPDSPLCVPAPQSQRPMGGELSKEPLTSRTVCTAGQQNEALVRRNSAPAVFLSAGTICCGGTAAWNSVCSSVSYSRPLLFHPIALRLQVPNFVLVRYYSPPSHTPRGSLSHHCEYPAPRCSHSASLCCLRVRSLEPVTADCLT